MIKKYKNGNIHLSIKADLLSGYYNKNDIRGIENFYHNDMQLQDLYIEEIKGYLFIIDYNKNNVYDMPHNHFIMFLEGLSRGKKYILYALNKKESKELLQELNNRY